MEQYIINTIKDNLESIENNLSAISANANVISHVAGQVKYVNKATRNVTPVAKMTAEQNLAVSNCHKIIQSIRKTLSSDCISDTQYYAVLEDGHVAFIEITPEMQRTIDTEYKGDEEDYFAAVVCEKHNISFNNCQWGITSESCIACYGKKPNIT